MLGPNRPFRAARARVLGHEDGLSAGDGKILDSSSGRRATYGELTRGADLVVDVPADAPLTPASTWKVAGAPASKVDGRDFVTGRHRYSSDWSLPEMLHGRVLRPASFRATLVSLDASAVERMPGVRFVRSAPRLYTSAGVSAGVDLALHVVAELAGGQARAATEAEMEWMWDRDQALLG